jgi:putative Mg2+ transporter-C (MgtC) family protein
MFAALAKFRTIDRTSQRTIRPRRLAARPTRLVQSNDNWPSARPVVAARPLGHPVLIACWERNSGSGRIECYWIVETVDAQSAETPLLIVVQAAINLAVATALGAAIGFERQWRQRMAGLRTNTLVAIGAASFVIFESLIPGDSSPTRVAAQVVSGIGFLGAGIIFREGFNVTGLNTAATLWCSAAVGLLAGAGQSVHAALATAFVIFANLGMRPLVRIINRQPIGQTEVDIAYRVRVVCRNPDEAHIRALLLQAASTSQLSLRRLESVDLENTDRVEVTAHLTAQARSNTVLEQIVGRLSLEPTVSAASWSMEALAE